MVIHSFLDSLEHICVKMIRNENIKTFEDIARYLELGEPHLKAVETPNAFIIKSPLRAGNIKG